jgi:membrane-bound lytic murein transglycosylase MltF
MKAYLPAIAALVALRAAAQEDGPRKLFQPFTGDLDAIVERRVIRALVPPSRSQYWIDGGRQSGSQYELLLEFEKELNQRYKVGGKHVRLHVSFIPTPPERLIPALLSGQGDLAAGLLTVTEDRLQQVDFSDPFYRDVAEIVVTGPAAPELTSLDALSGMPVFVRKSSSYWSHLETLGQRFAAAGRPPVDLKAAPEDLLDEDVLEMVNAGMVGVTVVDRYLATQWSRVLKKIRAREDLKIHEGGAIAWMVRKNNPLLKAEISRFAASHGQGSTFGNILLRRYGPGGKRVRSATSPGEMKKFEKMKTIFRKYAERYDLDYLLLMAQGYQESRLDHNARSTVGAVGVMQVMPATGAEMKTGDITRLEPNIHAGVKYIRFLQDRYFEPLPMDSLNKTLFTFAAYNAGPARVAQLRSAAAARGLNPNVWLNNVEIIAAQKIGSETVTYVSNIYKYYVAYKLMDELGAERRRALEAVH